MSNNRKSKFAVGNGNTGKANLHWHAVKENCLCHLMQLLFCYGDDGMAVMMVVHLEDEIETKESDTGVDGEQSCILHLYPVSDLLTTFLKIKQVVRRKSGGEVEKEREMGRQEREDGEK